MISDTGCCGFHFDKSKVTLFGLLTLSLPAIVLCGASNAILYMIGKISPHAEKVRRWIMAVQTANLKLVSNTDLNSKFRCRMTGKIFLHSPEWAGIIYRYFNILLLVLFWIATISCIYAITLIVR